MELAALLALLGAAQALLGAARALSTCRTLDLELARRKRIEAIRGQILSKLRLAAPPADAPARPLPEEVAALYNSSREALRERARLRQAAPPPPDDYYALELHRFPAERGPGQGPLEHWQPTSHSTFFVFNASRVRAEIGHEALLHRAELRMLRQRATAETLGAEQRLELYQGYGNASWRYLHGRSVQATAEEEWLWFDVTDVVQQWISGREPLGVFKLSVHCPCERSSSEPENMKITIEAAPAGALRAGHGAAARAGQRAAQRPAPARPRHRLLLRDGGEELLRAAALHRLPQGPAVEVDPRAQGLHGQLLHGALPLRVERRHPVHQGAGAVQPAQPRGVGGALLRAPEPGPAAHRLLRGAQGARRAALQHGRPRLQVQLTPPPPPQYLISSRFGVL
ncbi:transforming growth factor beta-1 proprotein isoform X1 [Struthio camelus]|uniref:transforming growth factor beta-1 proprotein isoform X1 n=1 Tax=Struthio camelus TaxID=8801 RepID=UPI003603CC0B